MRGALEEIREIEEVGEEKEEVFYLKDPVSMTPIGKPVVGFGCSHI